MTASPCEHIYSTRTIGQYKHTAICLFILFCLALSLLHTHKAFALDKPAKSNTSGIPAPRIELPKGATGTVINVKDFGAKPNDDKSDWQAFAAAIKDCKKHRAATLLIPKGRYLLRKSGINPGKSGHILLQDMSDLTIDGQGSELVFHHILPGFQFVNCQRILIKDLTVDWGVRLASAAVAQKDPDAGCVLRVLNDYPITKDTPIGEMSGVSEYDMETHRWVIGGEEHYFPKNVKELRPQVFSSPDFQKLSAGKTFVIRHHVYSANAFDFNGRGNADLTFDNITIFSSPGHNFVGYGCERGFHFNNCRIARREKTGRLISGASDGIHLGATLGDILIENCDFSYMGDDAINIHGAWMRLTKKPDGRTVEMTSRWMWAIHIDNGDELKFCRADNLQEIAVAKATDVNIGKTKIRVTLDRDLPEGINEGNYVGNISRSSPNFIIRNNYFHDHRARGMLIQARNGLIEKNRIERVMAAAIQMTTDCNYWQEGFGCENVVVRKNTIKGCNYAAWERGPYGRHMACINLIVDTKSGLGSHPVHRNIVIADNKIEDTPGLAILVASSCNVTVANNHIIDANTQPFGDTGKAIDAQAKGAIMVTRAKDVKVTGNRFSGKTTPLVFVDERNTADIIIKNNGAKKR